MAFYIGIMSGTSMDGIDAVLVSIKNKFEGVIAHQFLPFPKALENKLRHFQKTAQASFYELGKANRSLGESYAKAVQLLLKKSGIRAEEVTAIGCHGQTIYHATDIQTYPFTMQIGDPNVLSALTGITVVYDFRGMDVAHGGYGAPLVPKFHAYLFASASKSRVILNLGGIANLTILLPEQPVRGFDCGPANCLLDDWVQYHFPQQRYDQDGRWAASGTVQLDLLSQILQDSYFKKLPPKSTGREYFNLKWLYSYLEAFTNLKPNDVQATLCELVVQTISRSINQFLKQEGEVYICGGGAKNRHLMERLPKLLNAKYIATTDKLGLPAMFVEASAFAWLAHCRLHKITGNITSVTGASNQVILGSVCFP